MTITSLSLQHVDLVNNPNGALGVVDTAITAVAEKAAALGRRLHQIGIQDRVTADYIDILRESIGRAVDANLPEEAAQSTAELVRFQLAVQVFSIANGNASTVLNLLPGGGTPR